MVKLEKKSMHKHCVKMYEGINEQDKTVEHSKAKKKKFF